MQKFIPLIVVIAAFIIGVIAWNVLYKAPVPAPVETATTTAATSTGALGPQVGETTMIDGKPVKVVGKSIWADFDAPSWKILFKYKYEPAWIVHEYGDGKTLTSISFSDNDTDIFMSRNNAIAEPAGKPTTIVQTTIAGFAATQHIFASPSGQYAYYDYFIFPVGGDTYYIQVKSKTGSHKDEQDFLDFISIKK